MIPRLHNKTYEERLKELKPFPLTKRRLRVDLIIVYKIFKGFMNVNPNDYFIVDRSNITPNNGFKMIGKHFETNESKYFFIDRVVNYGMDCLQTLLTQTQLKLLKIASIIVP